MNAVVWFLAGAAAGWVTCSVLNLRPVRGVIVSAIIGTTGTFFGGDVFAAVVFVGPGAVTPFGLLVACVGAIASLKIGEIVYRRFHSDGQRLPPQEHALP
jgi:uncharacterized membrane protein YeaQ/YmgE (transglycosylase-associated protein family)